MSTFRKTSLRVWAAIFERKSPFFELAIFPCFRPNPYTRMCASTIGSFSLFRNILKQHCKTQVESWFGFFFLIWDFSVYFNYLSRITFWGRGDTPPFPPMAEHMCIKGNQQAIHQSIIIGSIVNG